MKKYYLLIVISVLVSCAPKKKSDASAESAFQTGDIVVSNSTSRDVKVFDSNGVYKRTILDLDNTSGQAPYGLAFNPMTNEIMIAVEGTTNRLIKAFSLDSLTLRDFSLSPALNNVLRGLAMLPSGDLLVAISIATNGRVEKLSGITGTQVTAGSWPKILQNGATGIDARANGSFVHCSTTSDVVRLYDAAGAQTATAASGIAGTTDVMDCKADSSGNIYTVFNGTTDTIRKYDSTLGTTTWSYSNTVLLPNPTGIAINSDGTSLVLDQTLNYIIKIAADGASATMLGGDTDNMLSTPQFILVIP